MLGGFFRGKCRVLVAYSGGLDSSVLAKEAYDALGDGALAVTFDTPTLPRRELRAASETAKAIGIRHIIVGYDELTDVNFRGNPEDRCYHCKRLMAEKLKEVAAEHGIECIVEGTTAEDLSCHRPGYMALREEGIHSPMVEAGLTKKDVRRLAEAYGLDHGKPPGACLASRVPAGREVTRELLAKIEEAEDYLQSLGLRQVRVRVEGETARIEVYRDEFEKVMEHSEDIAGRLPFRRVSLDLMGYS